MTFLVFGAVLLGPTLEHLSWQVVLYALLSLTVVRMLPGGDLIVGKPRESSDGVVHGLVDPRGLASIVFAVVVEDTHQAHSPTILGRPT